MPPLPVQWDADVATEAPAKQARHDQLCQKTGQHKSQKHGHASRRYRSKNPQSPAKKNTRHHPHLTPWPTTNIDPRSKSRTDAYKRKTLEGDSDPTSVISSVLGIMAIQASSSSSGKTPASSILRRISRRNQPCRPPAVVLRVFDSQEA